ncbi:MAG: hypothetical protein JXR96_04385 [Deltaproteobacteria bacterium]|nr:hypothetical protein [Deltaproteobacteria bacterium]
MRTVRTIRRASWIFLAVALAAWLVAGCGSDSVSAGETTAAACQDREDNDNDGDIDCNDSDCLGYVFCAAGLENSPGLCRDGTDNDGDDDTDCDDTDCQDFVVCASPTEDNSVACQDGADNDDDGRTDCEDDGCEGFVFCTPETEDTASACQDSEDNDGDGQTDCDDTDCQGFVFCASGMENTAGVCNDRQDNDGDNLTDCADPDCQVFDFCAPAEEKDAASCQDGRDNDHDGQTDCNDTDCQGYVFCFTTDETTAFTCQDGQDNDGDSLTDCEDTDCQGFVFCSNTEVTSSACQDGTDNDGDGFTDCLDTDCQGFVFCLSEESTSAACQDGTDNDNDGLTDCLDTDCQGFVFCLSEETTSSTCQDGVDNDSDGQTDCLDTDCQGFVFCAAQESGAAACQDGLDNDADGDTDCDDPDCIAEYACRPHTKVKAWYKEGVVTACKDAGEFETIPDMLLAIDLDTDHVVLTDFDINWVGASGHWMAARLNVDGDVDTKWTHTQPQGSTNEDDHVHLHRVDVLPAGTYQVSAEWGQGSGTMCNNPGSGGYWGRRIGVLAIPVWTGVQSGYVTGLTNECKSAGTYSTIPDMSIALDLAEPCEVLIQLDMNYVGCDGCWMATRFNVDGTADIQATHSQPIGGGDEEDHVQLFKIVSMDAGQHTVAAEWGQGSGIMCNNPEDGDHWTRRLSAVAIPVSSGVQSYYIEGASDISRSAGSYVTIPDMSLEMTDLPMIEPMILLTHFNMNFAGNANGDWIAARLVLDGTITRADRKWTHAQPSHGSEDDILHLFRLDYVVPGYYQMRAEWGDGGGSVYNLSGDSRYIWTRRLGVLAFPAGLE